MRVMGVLITVGLIAGGLQWAAHQKSEHEKAHPSKVPLDISRTVYLQAGSTICWKPAFDAAAIAFWNRSGGVQSVQLALLDMFVNPPATDCPRTFGRAQVRFDTYTTTAGVAYITYGGMPYAALTGTLEN